jgi:hypothetical protein
MACSRQKVEVDSSIYVVSQSLARLRIICLSSWYSRAIPEVGVLGRSGEQKMCRSHFRWRRDSTSSTLFSYSFSCCSRYVSWSILLAMRSSKKTRVERRGRNVGAVKASEKVATNTPKARRQAVMEVCPHFISNVSVYSTRRNGRLQTGVHSKKMGWDGTIPCGVSHLPARRHETHIRLPIP